MSSLNKVLIIGRLGKDPEVKVLQSQQVVCNLTVATSEKSKDGKEKTEWHNVQVWGKTAENCGKYLKKGSLAYFEGRLHTRSWEKDGVKHYTTEIVANAVQFLNSKNDGEQKPSEAKKDSYEDMEDIPF